jgi:hypothetical protein
VIKTAILSPCGRYRYRLARRWSTGPVLCFLMLNPSTADADVDDATIRRCIRFAQDQGFGALEVVNLYAFRATKPADLRLAGYPTGPDNDDHTLQACQEADEVCLAYGAGASGMARPQEVLPMLRRAGVQLQCLRITRSGYPAHPLYLPADCRLMPFTIEAVQEAMAT